MPTTTHPGDEALPSVASDDVTYLLKQDTSLREKRMIAIVEVNAAEQVEVELGTYAAKGMPKGFTVEYEPVVDLDSAIEGSLVAIYIGNTGAYKLMLSFVNRSSITVMATVWEMVAVV